MTQPRHLCNQCGKELQTLQGLRSHITRIHGDTRTLQSPGPSRLLTVQSGVAENNGASLQSESLLKLLSQARQRLKLVRIIPRGVREPCAHAYAIALANFN